MLLLTRYTLLTELVAARLSLTAELIVVRYSRIDVPRCVLFIALVVTRFSLLIPFTRRLLHTFRSILLAASFYLLPFDSSLLVGPFLLLSVIYWPPAFRCFFLASRCLFIFLISRRTNCMLLVIPKLANHISSFAAGCCLSHPLLAERT